MKPLQSKIERIYLTEFFHKNVEVYLKREDLLHPTISGNKYRKLFYNIQAAKNEGYNCLLTFGGAYSNHILATASAGAEFGFKTIGVIRGEELGVDLKKTLDTNPTLKAAHEFGMEFYFVSRSEYREKTNISYVESLQEKFPNSYILPEGGTNELAIKGCEDILGEDTESFDFICTAVGTGGTISGIINASLNTQKILGFPALKGEFLEKEIKNNSVNKNNWQLVHEFHFGGYAKLNEELIIFNNKFFEQTKVLLDPVYTGKMCYGVIEKIKKNEFPNGSKILIIHTGGLQGILGMNTLLEKKGLPLLIHSIHE